MFCTECGANLPENTGSCFKCGKIFDSSRAPRNTGSPAPEAPRPQGYINYPGQPVAPNARAHIAPVPPGQPHPSQYPVSGQRPHYQPHVPQRAHGQSPMMYTPPHTLPGPQGYQPYPSPNTQKQQAPKRSGNMLVAVLFGSVALVAVVALVLVLVFARGDDRGSASGGSAPPTLVGRWIAVGVEYYEPGWGYVFEPVREDEVIYDFFPDGTGSVSSVMMWGLSYSLTWVSEGGILSVTIDGHTTDIEYILTEGMLRLFSEMSLIGFGLDIFGSETLIYASVFRNANMPWDDSLWPPNRNQGADRPHRPDPTPEPEEMWIPDEDFFISSVYVGYLATHPGIPIGFAFDQFFINPSWTYYCDGPLHYVSVHGYIFQEEEYVMGHIIFQFSWDGLTWNFAPVNLIINGIWQDVMYMHKLLDEIMANVQW